MRISSNHRRQIHEPQIFWHRSSQCDPDVQRVDGFTHVVHAQQARAILRREERRGNAAGGALARGAPGGELSDHAFARHADQQRIAEGDERRQ